MREIELTNVFRQSNPLEAALMNRIRTGTLTRKDYETINKRVQPPAYDAIYLSPYRRTVKAINEHRNSELNSKRYYFKREESGKIDRIVDALPELVEIREGARVIIKKNIQRIVQNRQQVVINGDTGCFLGLDKYQRAVIMVDRLSDVVYLRQEKILQTKPYIDMRDDGTARVKDKKLGYVKQYPFDIGFAMTIHSAQGSTLKKVHLALPRGPANFTPNLLYVGMSRTRSLSALTLSRKLAPCDIVSTESSTTYQQYDLDANRN